MPEALLQNLPALPEFSILAAVALLAGTMRGFSGFGAGLLMAPVYVLILPPADVVVVILLLNLITTFPMLREAMRDVHWPLLWRIYIPSLFGVPIGLAMLHLVDAAIMRRAVASIVSLVAIFMLAGWVYTGARGRLQDCLAGMMSGFMTAIGGIGGPPLVLYLLSDRAVRPTAFRAFSLVFFLLVQVGTLIPMAFAGAISAAQLSICAALLPVYVVANLLGATLHRRTAAHHEALVRRICLLFLLSVGLVALVI